MKDSITLKRIDLLHPLIREEVKSAYDEICDALNGRAICRFAYTLRTDAEQNALYAQGRIIPNTKVVTNAKGGQSYHNYGLALDIVLLVDKDKNGSFESASWETNVDFDGDGKADWQEVVQILKRYGFTWGGEWKFTDMPHFEKSFGYSISQLAKIKKDEMVDSEGYVLLNVTTV